MAADEKGPRPRYESDERYNEARRAIKPHFKAHHSVQNHPRTTAIYADNDLLAMWLRIGILASERGAAHTGDWLTMSLRDVARMSGRSRRDIALSSLQRLCEILEWSFERRGEVVSIHVRNFARKQGLAPRSPRSAPPDSAELRGAPRTPPRTPHTAERTEESDNAHGLPPERPSASPESLVWNAGIAMLRDRGGLSEDSARRFLGMLAKGDQKPALMEAVGAMVAENPIEPKGYLFAAMKRRANGNGKKNDERLRTQGIDWEAVERNADHREKDA